MNALDGIVEEMDTRTFDLIERKWKPVQNILMNYRKLMAKVIDLIQVYQETGEVIEVDFENWNNPTVEESETDSVKENVVPNQQPDDAPLSTSRPRRNAFKAAAENISHQTLISSSTKLRRPSVTSSDHNIYIKTEKGSFSSAGEVKIKTENEIMPAPRRPGPKKRKRAASSKIQIKQEKTEEIFKGRDSDVIVEDVAAPSVIVLDSDDEEVASTRTTKTKSKRTKKQIKKTETDSSSNENRQKTEKSDSEHKENVSAQTVYEDAVDDLNQSKEAMNATFVSKSTNLPALNATVVIENPTYVKSVFTEAVTQGLLTDDESEDEKVVPKTVVKSTVKASKQVFSPFEQSPVKKKVEAFEKLKEEASALPVRVTRTKTRALAKDKEEKDDDEIKSNVKEKAKFFTPAPSRFIPEATSTTTKIRKQLTPHNESLLSAKSASALKASQAESREREKKRKEKELDVRKKREALLHAQIEEKKRKREEKQLKAQQQREVLEKEKQKVLEAQRLKDERHKQLVAEQEERRLKSKVESEKKRMLAKMRAIEEKKREEEKRLEEIKKEKELSAAMSRRDKEIAEMMEKIRNKKPTYLVTEAPLLPTDDCYDSDDERYHDAIIRQPEWTRYVKKTELIILAAGDTVKNSFFWRQAQSPDLRDIFENIDVRKLKRSSSAIWHKPPRYTMMPSALDKYDETDELLDDSCDE